MIWDGGPAYPVFAMYRGAGGDLHPTPTQLCGMSMRDAMAIAALPEAWRNVNAADSLADLSDVAEFAYRMADAMLAERARTMETGNG